MSRKAFRFHSRKEEEKEDDKGKGSISDDYVQKMWAFSYFCCFEGGQRSRNGDAFLKRPLSVHLFLNRVIYRAS